MMKKLNFFFAFLFGTFSLFSCQQKKADFYTFDGSALSVQADNGTYTIQPYSKYVVKVNFANAQAPAPSASHAVVLPPASGIASIANATDSTVTLTTGEVSVKVTLKPFSIEFSKANELALRAGSAFVSDTLRGFQFDLQANESIYGAGERALPMNRRGYRFELYNAPHYSYEWGSERLNYSLPVVTSSNKYMLFFDNPQKGFLDIGKTQAEKLEWSAIGGELSYYYIGHESFAGLTEQYTALTGTQDLPPRWAFGYLLSRFGYKSEKETRKILDDMNKAGFPIDAVILDLYWFGEEIKGTMGNLDWHAPNWPNPKGMIEDFKRKNVQTILITEPFVLQSSSTFADADAQKILALDANGNTFIDTGFYFGHGGIIDIFKLEAQDWFWKKYKKQIDLGVGGWWGDLGEPERHPEGMIHSIGKADEVHNIYGHYWDKMLYDRYAQEYPNTRLFNLNRSGFAGSQRFSIFPWTGDVTRSWAGLKAQIPLMLTMGMSGLGYVHSDLGGFTPAPKNEELYLRWLQMGVFNPIFRPHSSELPSEPIFYSKNAQSIVKQLVSLRYSMLPYNYTTAWQNATKGWPLARPLFFEDATDERLKDAYHAYMWGDNLLVAPILEGGQKEVSIYLPKGQWFSFWTDEAFDGGKDVLQKLSLEQIPVFVKAGAFIPMADIAGNMGTYSPENLTVHYYPHASVASSACEVYEDDGATKQAERKGQFEILSFKGTVGNGLTIDLGKSGNGYANAPSTRNITLVVHGQTAGKTVSVGGNALAPAASMKALVQGTYFEKGLLYVKFTWDGKAVQVAIQ